MTNPKGLLASIAIIFSFDASFGSAQIHVNGYRNISNGKGTTLTINAKNRTVVLRKNNGTLRFFTSNGTPIYTFTSSTGKFKYRLNWKAEKTGAVAGLSRTKNEILFSAQCDDKQNLKKFSKSLKSIDDFLNNSTEQVGSVNLIDQSCKSNLDATQRKLLNNDALKMFTQKSSLASCLNNKSAMEKLSNLPDASSNIDLIVNELINTQALLSKGESPLSIACEETQPPATFNAKYLNNRITFPVGQRGEDRYEILTSRCSPLEVTLAHEIVHKSGISDEKVVHAIQGICMGATHPELKKDCPKEFECSDDPAKCSKVATQLMIAETLKAEQDQNQPQVRDIINNQLAKNEIQEIKVSDSDWKTLESSDSSGQTTSVTRSIASTMSSNFDRMANTVNQAIGMIESPANAATSGGSLASKNINSESVVKNTFKVAAAGDKYYTTQEYLADKFPVSAKRGVASLGAPVKSGTDSTVAARSAQNAAVDTGSVADGELGSESLSANFGSTRPISRSSSGQNPQATAQASRRIANETNSESIVVLQQKEVVTGEQYMSIKKLYNSAAFKRDLVSQGIMISIPDEGINIGVASARATLKLIDDGSSIRRTGAR